MGNFFGIGFAKLLIAFCTAFLLQLLDSRSIHAAPSIGFQNFVDWCRQAAQLTSNQQHTVAVLLRQAQTTDCLQAEQALLEMPGLSLPSQGLTDLSPLVALPHLTNLNLTDNQISDLSPLRHLPNLSFLLVGRNQIEDVSPLAALTALRYVVLEQNQIRDVSTLSTLGNLTVLTLLSNPIAPKICPVTPSQICQFSDAAADSFAVAEQQFQQGQFQAALQGFQAVLKVYEQEGDRHRQGDTLNRLGDVHLQLGDYPQALVTFEQTLNLRQEIADDSGVVASLTSLATVYERLALYEKAQDLLQQALIALQGQNPLRLDGGGVYEQAREEGALYIWQARLYTRQGYPKRALTALDQAQSLYENLPSAIPQKRFDQRRLVETRGAAHLKLGQTQQAVSVLKEALVIAAEIGDRTGTATTLTLLGETFRQQGDPTSALDAFRKALVIQQAIGDQPGAGVSLHNIGETLLQIQAYPEATTALLRAINIWESLRPGLADANKVALFETQARTYEHLQAALVAQNQPEQALEMAERGRARAFVELLAAKLGGDVSDQFQQPTPPTLAQIRDIARTQKATLVEYSLLPNQLLIWVVTSDGVVSLRTVDLEKLPQQSQRSLPHLVQAVRQAMGVSGRAGIAVASALGSSPPNAQGLLQQLHQFLIAPIADLLPTNPEERVILIPHRDLFLVPFPALLSDGGPLIGQHTLLSAPSIQLLHYTHQRRQQLPKTTQATLIVGNPDMPTLSLGVDQPAQPLDPLPGAEQEAIAIATLLRTQPLLGAAATEAAVVERMSTASIIHLATHGLLDELNHLGLTTPGAIALTPTSSAHSSRSTDGLLTTAEILELNLQANLVVLSACNTGIGRITGDGVIGLSRAIMAAGAPSLVVSLWAVPDAPTAELMTAFYQYLQHTPDKAQALRQAMLNTLEQYPNPRDWAAFTLMGQAL